ncbi:MAG: phosphate ABC transporter permease subunit PstC [Cytophagaceae bacterium]|jgi:phosphate transport system permease protein|nr:phosphate ABC transporter permease subunit PstC [Cytophagaceae bacterium]
MKLKEKIIEGFLLSCSLLTILTTVGIIGVLIVETFGFFQEVSFWEFISDKEWTPLFADKHFGILPLLTGTLLTTLIAIIVAVPLGITIAIYLSEYAHPSIRTFIKPSLEILAAIPTVVYGYFALVYVTPMLQYFIPSLSGFNALSPGIVMGVMILPLVSSLSEDALYSVPKTLREGSLAMGATKFQTAFRVVVPAAFSGIAVSIILSVSRAIGETMIVAIAAGQQPRLTFNPLVPIETATTYIVQVSQGDLPQDSIEYKTIYAVGMSLFVITLLLNNISFWLKKKYHQAYK